MDKFVVGIDLGTTFSAIACVNEQLQPEIIRNADGKSFTPSAVLIEDGNITVGEIAVNQWITNEEHVVRWIKRNIGEDNYSFQEMNPVDISAEILKSLKNDAENQYGMAIDEAVITCPAYFDSNEIENTKLAGEKAGLKIKEIVKEPTAAAIYYGIENMRDGEVIMVCDLGGGTFDATILKLENGSFKPIATGGDRELGGHDWTKDLYELVCNRFMEQGNEDPGNDLITGQTLYEECEKAKRDFSKLSNQTVSFNFQGQNYQIEVSRQDFEDATEWLIEKMIGCVEFTLDKANMAWKDIDEILLVGGSSRLRRMGKALEELSNITPKNSNQPDLMVALGAAIMAKGKVLPRGGLIEDLSGGLILDEEEGGLIVDYTRNISRSLGTRALSQENGEYAIINSLVIPHSTEVPEDGLSKSSTELVVSVDDQEFFEVPVVEFEDEYDYDVLGNYCFILPSGARKGDPIKITFHYDVSGIVSVDAFYKKLSEPLKKEKKEYIEPNLEEITMSVTVNPMYIVFSLDTSFSMEFDNLLDKAKQALSKQVEELFAICGKESKIGVVTFGSSAKIMSQMTNDEAQLKNAIGKIVLSGTTAMDEGIQQAWDLVKTAPAGVKRHIVLLTDGMPDTDRTQKTLDVAARVIGSGIELSALSLGEDGIDKEYLGKLTPINFTIDIKEGSSGITKGLNSILTQSNSATAGEGGLMENSLSGLFEEK